MRRSDRESLSTERRTRQRLADTRRGSMVKAVGLEYREWPEKRIRKLLKNYKKRGLCQRLTMLFCCPCRDYERKT